MFRSDAQQETKNSPGNIANITVDVICEIEKELRESPYDVISLVFLLYDIPETALQRLLFYQRVAGDATATNLNLLQEWAQQAKSRSSWKHEFLEALLICQLYGIVKKLGLHLPSTKQHYQPDNLHVNMHINPMKKALYKVCENIDSNNLARLKSTLQNYKIDTTELDSCELIFLKLISQKFITMTQIQYDKKVLGCQFKVDKLVKILEKLPGLEGSAQELRLLQSRTSDEPAAVPVATSTPFTPPSDVSKPLETPMTLNDFADIFELMEELKIEDENHLKSDTIKMGRDKYAIKNTKSLGVCLIINQEDFCLSEKSIDDETLTTVLGKRKGSTADKRVLETTMSSLNFEVVIGENLNHTAMIDFIKDTIRDKVKSTDSIFMLCILSHGVRGHVYAADCVKVNVENIQGILDSDGASMLRGIPKVMIIQACQVDETQQSSLVADSPVKRMSNYYLKKSDFLIYWATAPQYEAFRDEKIGSIFIQLLCGAIQKRGRREHLYDIFTLVNNGVQLLCREKKCQQVPIFESTLRKKLYLHIPE